MVQLADHDGGRRIGSGDRPRRQHAGDGPAAPAAEPHQPHRDRHRPRPDDRQRGRDVVPGPNRGMQARRLHGEEVDDRIGAGRRERPPHPPGARDGRPGQQPHHSGTRVERHVRPRVIAGVPRPVSGRAGGGQVAHPRQGAVQAAVDLQGGEIARRHRLPDRRQLRAGAARRLVERSRAGVRGRGHTGPAIEHLPGPPPDARDPGPRRPPRWRGRPPAAPPTDPRASRPTCGRRSVSRPPPGRRRTLPARRRGRAATCARSTAAGRSVVPGTPAAAAPAPAPPVAVRAATFSPSVASHGSARWSST